MWKILRWMLLPAGAVGGAVLAPPVLMPDPAELRRAGAVVDGTGYGSAALLGLLLGLIGAYVLRSAVDFVLERDDTRTHHDQAP